jgi:hypothetical protein
MPAYAGMTAERSHQSTEPILPIARQFRFAARIAARDLGDELAVLDLVELVGNKQRPDRGTDIAAARGDRLVDRRLKAFCVGRRFLLATSRHLSFSY